MAGRIEARTSPYCDFGVRYWGLIYSQAEKENGDEKKGS